MLVTNEYLLYLNKIFTVGTSDLAEQLLLFTKRWYNLTKVLKLRHKVTTYFKKAVLLQKNIINLKLSLQF